MVPSGLPTGTVSSGRTDPSASERSRGIPDDADGDARARIAELERENEALRAAIERQRRENEEIVERYERLLERDRELQSDADESAGETDSRSTDGDGVGFLSGLVRAVRFGLGR
ncbi:MAG: hypothetical protein ABEI80_01645 [Haloplanus sp.]